MIPLDNPKKYIKEFFDILSTNYRGSKEEFQNKYYRALLANPRVRLIRNKYFKKDFNSVKVIMNEILSENYNNKTHLENQFNITIYNIIKFHLDNFQGKSNKDQTLVEIERELNKVINGIFFNNPPLHITVEDTSNLENSLESKFKVKINPKQLLF